jgi:TolA-binding protein
MEIDGTVAVVGLIVSLLTIVGFAVAVVRFISAQGAKSALQEKATHDNEANIDAAHNKIRELNNKVEKINTDNAVQQNEIENIKDRLK